jgi:hypothetical protein
MLRGLSLAILLSFCTFFAAEPASLAASPVARVQTTHDAKPSRLAKIGKRVVAGLAMPFYVGSTLGSGIIASDIATKLVTHPAAAHAASGAAFLAVGTLTSTFLALRLNAYFSRGDKDK